MPSWHEKTMGNEVWKCGGDYYFLMQLIWRNECLKELSGGGMMLEKGKLWADGKEECYLGN